ncbi:MAG TPA: hypothetical protein VFX98_14770 [Longimicrobiaceae bacterium]|nr:hypothetical protein [Longimicrobiaceae bacterium]
MLSNSTSVLKRAAVLLAVLAPAAFVRAPQDEVRAGWLHVTWWDPAGDARGARVSYHLVDDEGDAVELLLGDLPAGSEGPLALDRRRVTVRGSRVRAGRRPALRVRSVARQGGARFSLSPAPASGARPYVTLLCRYADVPDTQPQPRATYEAWMTGSGYPTLDHYWREASEGRVNLAGSRVFGPYVLPGARSDYVANGEQLLDKLVKDCTGAADADVHFPSYAGITLQFNADLNGFSYGGSWTVAADGQARPYPMMWMASWAGQSTYAHEIGHSFGLPHSSGPYEKTYDSKWDVMSGGGARDPELGTHVGNHTIAWHKDRLGWIPAARRYVAAPGNDATLLLERGAAPGSGGYQLAVIPLSGDSVFYTVEARRPAGYDGPPRLPGDAVVIHRVHTRRLRPAQVVDVDGNGNPNDTGAGWTPLETFTDEEAGVSVRVLEPTASGFRVGITVLGPLAADDGVAPPPARMGAEYTHRLAPAGTSEGVVWRVVAGSLPEGVKLAEDGTLSGIPAQSGAFACTVEASTARARGTRQLTLQVDRPVLQPAAVTDHLLTGVGLSPDEARFVDLLGNRNGRLDVGDVRAWLAQP